MLSIKSYAVCPPSQLLEGVYSDLTLFVPYFIGKGDVFLVAFNCAGEMFTIVIQAVCISMASTVCNGGTFCNHSLCILM